MNTLRVENMGIKSTLGKGIPTPSNLKRWLAFDQLKRNTAFVKDSVQFAFNQDTRVKKETFEEAMKRFHMTEEDLVIRIKNGRRTTVFCLLLGILILAYCFYLFSTGQLLAAFSCFMLSCVMFTYALRESFNVYQIRQRRLGCSFREYFKSLVSKGKLA